MAVLCRPRAGPLAALVLTPRHGGLAVLDGFGPAPGTPVNLNLRGARTDAECRGVVESALRRLLRRHQPALVVVGVPAVDSAGAAALRDFVLDLMTALDVPAVVREVTAARRELVGSDGGPEPGSFVSWLRRGFFPGEPALEARNRTAARYRWHVWGALTLALAELVRRRPRSAVALAQPAAFESAAFVAAVWAAELTTHPRP